MQKLYSGARNARVLSVFLLGVLCLGAFSFGASERLRSRISPVLEDEVFFLSRNPAYDYAIPVIVKLKTGIWFAFRLMVKVPRQPVTM